MKLEPHFNCLNGEHVFIPAYTKNNGRDSWVTEFVCQHCLMKVDLRAWQIHQNRLKDMPVTNIPDAIEIKEDKLEFAGAPMALLDDMPPPKKPNKKK